MHDRHVKLPLVAAILMLNIGPDQLDILVWCVQELNGNSHSTSNENGDNANLTEFMRTFQQMANAMHAQATAAEHMMDQLLVKTQENTPTKQFWQIPCEELPVKFLSHCFEMNL